MVTEIRLGSAETVGSKPLELPKRCAETVRCEPETVRSNHSRSEPGGASPAEPFGSTTGSSPSPSLPWTSIRIQSEIALVCDLPKDALGVKQHQVRFGHHPKHRHRGRRPCMPWRTVRSTVPSLTPVAAYRSSSAWLRNSSRATMWRRPSLDR